MAKLVIGTDKTVGVPAVVKEVVQVEKYPLLGRVKDDTNKDIGCVVGYHTDANNVKYAVVCLNKEFRKNTTFQWLSGLTTVPGVPNAMPVSGLNASTTATAACDAIVALAPDYTSAAVTECRSHSFVIDGTTYYGQMPTLRELMFVFLNFNYLNNNDPSASGPALSNGNTPWAANQGASGYAGAIYSPFNSFLLTTLTMTQSNYVYPILEIPIV